MSVCVWAALGSLLWLTWYISCSVLHAVMMVMHHAPPFPSDRVAYYFSPVLPAWPFIITIIYLTVWGIQPSGTSLLNSLPGSPSTDHCDWLLWLALDNTTGTCCTHDALLNFRLSNSGLFFSLIFFYPPCCGTNMLAMFCIRACSGLVGCRTATRALSLHSFPGITVAQVGLCFCLHVCVWQKFPVIKCCL